MVAGEDGELGADCCYEVLWGLLVFGCMLGGGDGPFG